MLLQRIFENNRPGIKIKKQEKITIIKHPSVRVVRWPFTYNDAALDVHGYGFVIHGHIGIPHVPEWSVNIHLVIEKNISKNNGELRNK